MSWTYTYHRFEDRDAYLAACDAAELARNEAGEPVPKPNMALDVIGTIWTGGTVVPETGAVVGQTTLPGYHVNAAWQEEMPSAFAASRLDPEPNKPVRVWA